MRHTLCNMIAAQSNEWLAALSDGIFAVAMTLLVLDLHTPSAETIHSEAELCATLTRMVPQFIMLGMSFLTLGVFWVAQQTTLNYFSRVNRHLVWLNLGFLFVLTLVPFSAHLLADFITYRVARCFTGRICC